ncbi:DUF4238 domain-containing protein [Streptacidiphilus sp. PB12-B1b]|uniref:DUF4238 domain-containing protein n=1 Tax=Streptacidiphilus sp. PB12-B1b TaxID=2705012 RepID=UPI0015FC294C|nr:DUF4238 domain-containing protein [Streptacidiphilus sp. PB12-B1b]QMU78855.1 DUF4238 domain-containing protein [Streptacidiphilus sp. PB12-B1b]
MSGRKQHYLPAALIGGFGDSAGRDPRDAVVVWRRRRWEGPREAAAQYIGWRPGMYRLNDPPPGVDKDVVDKVWETVEPHLPHLVERLAAGRETAEDHSMLMDYVAMAGVRHPNFAQAVNRWRAELGMPIITGDEVHVARLDVLTRGPQLVRGFRWRVLHTSPDAPRFILNDLSWTYIGQQGWAGRGLYFPLSESVALVGWLKRGLTGGFDHQVLRPNWVRWLNAATWTEAPEFIVGHPADALDLAQQRTAKQVSERVTLARGAFQDVAGQRFLFDEV